MVRISTVFVMALSLFLAVGCQMMPWGTSPESKIQATLDQWEAGMEAQNLDQIMAAYSENFVIEEEPGRKEALRQFMKNIVDMGYLAGAEVDRETTQITVEGDTASASPVLLKTSADTYTLSFDLAKEDAGWMITRMDYGAE